VDPAQQFAKTSFEGDVTAGAPQSARRPKVLHRRTTERAAAGFARRWRDLLLNFGKELPERVLRHARTRLHSLLRRASLAEMELADRVIHDLSEVHDGVALLATVA
jgi:hypothetical protein